MPDECSVCEHLPEAHYGKVGDHCDYCPGNKCQPSKVKGPKSHCLIHECDESVPETTYEVCFECGHVWLTEEDVLEAYQTFENPPIEGDFCPLCLHDWIN